MFTNRITQTNKDGPTIDACYRRPRMYAEHCAARITKSELGTGQVYPHLPSRQTMGEISFMVR